MKLTKLSKRERGNEKLCSSYLKGKYMGYMGPFRADKGWERKGKSMLMPSFKEGPTDWKCKVVKPRIENMGGEAKKGSVANIVSNSNPPPCGKSGGSGGSEGGD